MEDRAATVGDDPRLPRHEPVCEVCGYKPGFSMELRNDLDDDMVVCVDEVACGSRVARQEMRSLLSSGPTEPTPEPPSERVRLLRQSALSLVDHLRGCEACQWQGVEHCDDVSSWIAIVSYEAKELGDA